ncbi:MAG: glycosyltransferase family 4 protein, partial [Rhodocyclaceae bacterium]|nr:glycosyltransferase family 4 protein [Rhodocyclaceae bacterium]
MKLALVRQRYTPYGGAERFLALAIESLGKAGVDVEIIARSWQGTVVARRCDPFYLGRTWRDMSFARCVQRLLRSERYDLVQTHERIPGCHVYRAGDGVHATWLELSAKPWRLSCWHRYTLAAEDALFRAPDLRAVICNSHMVAADIARRWPMAAAKITVIHNGVDLERFHPRLRNERSRVRAR